MLQMIITLYSALNGIDPQIAFQMARIESNMNPNAISKTQDGGLFQLNKNYYKFHNLKWIFDPQVNSSLALGRLKKLKESCHYKINNTYVLCYNMGEAGARKIKNPYKQTYLKKMNILWRN